MIHGKRRAGGRTSVLALAVVLVVLFGACAQGAQPGTTTAATQPPTTASGGTEPPDEISIDSTDPQEIIQQLADYPREQRDAYILERAREEGVVTYYSRTAVRHLEGRAAAFRAAYPDIQVEFLRIEAGSVSERVRLERQGGQENADIIEASGLEALALFEEGFFVELHGVPIPEGYSELGHGPYWASSDFNPELIVWNTDLVAPGEEPTGYDDFLDPEWSGRFAIRDAPDNSVIAMLETRGEEGAREWLEGLVVDNEALVRVGSTAGATLLSAGEFDAHVGLLATTFIPSVEDEGAPLEFLFGDPFPAGITPFHINTGAPHPYAALLFIQFMLGPEGQADEADRGRVTLNREAELPYAGYQRLQDQLYEGDALLMTPELVAEHSDTAQELIEELIVPRIREG